MSPKVFGGLFDLKDCSRPTAPPGPVENKIQIPHAAFDICESEDGEVICAMINVKHGVLCG